MMLKKRNIENRDEDKDKHEGENEDDEDDSENDEEDEDGNIQEEKIYYNKRRCNPMNNVI